MTIRDCKRTALALADELSSTQVYPYTNDGDISTKLPIFITEGLRVLAAIQNIVRECVFENEAGEGEVVAFELPEDYFRLVRIIGDGARLTVDEKIEVCAPGRWVVEYAAMPRAVLADTSDDLELECSEEAATALPYYVAARLLMSDGDGAWVNFQSRFDGLAAALQNSRRTPGVRLVGRKGL